MQSDSEFKHSEWIENLFVGHFRNVQGVVATQDDPVFLQMRGELLLYVDVKDNEFEILDWQRIFLVGARNEQIQDDPIGVLSLGGPLPESDIEINNRFVDGLQMMLHYRLLSKEDPLRPSTERIEGQLNWENINVINENTMQVENLVFSTEDLLDAKEGYVESVKWLDAPSVTLYRINRFQSEAESPNAAHYSFLMSPPIIQQCPTPVPPCPSSSPTTDTTTLRQIPIKFINLTNNDIHAACAVQIEEVCTIWRKKAAVDVINWEIVDVPDGTDSEGKPYRRGFDTFTSNDEGYEGNIPERSGDHIDIVIVDSLNVTVGSDTVTNGNTYSGGTSDAVCILAYNHFIHNKRLLAHELCHVVRLDHPTPIFGWVPGSAGSIADVSYPLPFSNTNTEHNRTVLGSAEWPINPYYTGPIVTYCPDFDTDLLAPNITYLDYSGDSLKGSFPLASDISGSTLHFRVLVKDPGLSTRFLAESITFDVTWRRRNSLLAPESVTFAHTGAGWTPDSALPTVVTISNPVNSSATAVSGDVFEAVFNCVVEIRGEFEQIEINVNVTDYAGNSTPEIEAKHIIEVTIPTDIMLLLDYSGSMRSLNANGQSKWTAVREAANMFNAIFTALDVHEELDNRIGVVRFFTDGASGSDLTEVTSPLAPPTIDTLLVTDLDPSINHWTPMGSAVLKGHHRLKLSAPDWRNRIMILLTDGYENRTPMLDDVRAILPGNSDHIPSVMDDPQIGYQIHVCAFSPHAEVDTGTIQDLAIQYDSQSHSTESTIDPESAYSLKVQFLSLIADTFHAEPIEPIPLSLPASPSDYTFNLEPGIDELVCIVTDNNVPLTITPPPGTSIDPITVHTHSGITWAHISNPPAGDGWLLGGFTASNSVRGFAILDLTLRTKFDAARTDIGVGRPIPLWAEIKENGVGVSGATVTVKVEGPGESMGQLLTDYTRRRVINFPQLQNTLGHTPTLEPLSLQRQLLLAAYDQRGHGLRRIENEIVLTETEPGRYEGEWLDTLEEGTYSFSFTATGKTYEDYNFQRSYVLSRHLAPIPDPDLTTIFWSSRPLLDQKAVLWQAIITPRTASGRPLGPGLVDKLKLQFPDYVEDYNVEAIDNLNGSYTVELTLRPGQKPPPLTLGFGRQKARKPIDTAPTPARRVRILLKRIEVLDDKETWFPSPGELVFETALIPNDDIDRTVTRRIPPTGHISLSNGQSKALNLVLYDGYLEEGAPLEVNIGGTEMDNLLIFTKKDPVTRYRRRFTGDILSWAGEYTPEDEPDDPEALKDWKIWYMIEVI